MLLASLIAAASAQQRTHEVLVLHSADPSLVEGVRARIMRNGLLRDTDAWDLAAGVPSDADLAEYDAVLLWLHDPAPDAALLGDRLAGYVDRRGGGLVLAGETCDVTRSPTGRLAADGLLPWTAGQLGPSSGQRGIRLGQDHDLHGAVGLIDAATSPRCQGLVPRGPTPLGWTDGAPLVALHPTLRVAGVNLWPPDDDTAPGGWDAEGHGDQVLARALMWSSGWDWPDDAPLSGCRRATPEADRNCNGVLRSDEALVDRSDPVCSTTLDEDGAPYVSHDDYVEPTLHGCELPISPGIDEDGDGLGNGRVTLYLDPGLWWGEWEITCDACAEDLDPLQFDLDCDGVGDLCDPCPWESLGGDDQDHDGFLDGCDACVLVADPTQDDEDADGFGDACDRCPFTPDPWQLNGDDDPFGDACDPCPHLGGDDADADGDGIGDACDLCPGASDPDQGDIDQDLVGDACDVCPLDAGDGADQADRDRDGVGDRCDTCPDEGGVPQDDTDEDGVGDACDRCPEDAFEHPGDADGDKVPDECDVCVRIPDPRQRDHDGDRVGDACDVCPDRFDPDQLDRDADGLGNACDDVLLRGGGGLCRGGACDDAGAAGAGPIVLAAALVAIRRKRRSP